LLTRTDNLRSYPAPKPGVVESYSQGAAKEAGKQTVDYVANNPDTQQQLNDAEDKVKQGVEDAKQKAQVTFYICPWTTVQLGSPLS
jgi:two-component SAPR family response regulator